MRVMEYGECASLGFLSGGMAMRRREFIAGLGSAAGWLVVGRAQQPERMRDGADVMVA